MHVIDQRILEAGLVLPDRTIPAGNYLPVMQNQNLLYISGQFPLLNGKLVYEGQIGKDLSIKEGSAATELAALNVLAHLREETATWNHFGEIVRLDGYVNSAPGWYEQPKVLDAASDLFKKILGLQAGHARTAFSCHQLPLNAAVELVVIASVIA